MCIWEHSKPRAKLPLCALQLALALRPMCSSHHMRIKSILLPSSSFKQGLVVILPYETCLAAVAAFYLLSGNGNCLLPLSLLLLERIRFSAVLGTLFRDLTCNNTLFWIAKSWYDLFFSKTHSWVLEMLSPDWNAWLEQWVLVWAHVAGTHSLLPEGRSENMPQSLMSVYLLPNLVMFFTI